MTDPPTPFTRQYVAHLKYVAHIVALASLGFFGGVATLASFHYGRDFGDDTSLKGGLFGTVVAVYLFLFHRIRSPWKAALVIATSVVAYTLAVDVLGFLSLHFFAGSVGACLLFAAVLFLTAPDLNGLDKFRLVGLFGIGGGVLGTLGWTLGPSLGVRISSWLDQSGLWGGGFDMLSGIHDSVYAVLPVWQSGVGALIGVLLWALDRKTAPSEIPAKDRELSVPAKIFFAGILLVALATVFNVLRTVPGYWQAHWR
jgi:hypothetical protein